MERNHKTKKHGKLVKCDRCKRKMDLDVERSNGNIVIESGVTILYCDCGNEIIIKWGNYYGSKKERKWKFIKLF